jgi:hypothetical protein
MTNFGNQEKKLRGKEMKVKLLISDLKKVGLAILFYLAVYAIVITFFREQACAFYLDKSNCNVFSFYFAFLIFMICCFIITIYLWGQSLVERYRGEDKE